MKRIVAFWLSLSLLVGHFRAQKNDASEFYMNEYECIDKVLFDPKVFFVLQKQDEKACEIGVNFNLEQIFRKAEQVSLEEEGFKAIIEILDGKFGIGKESVALSPDEEIAKENQYDMELQQLAIEYLKSNIGRQEMINDPNSQRTSGILTPEMAEQYLGKLKTISNTMGSTMDMLGDSVNLDNSEFASNRPSMARKSVTEELEQQRDEEAEGKPANDRRAAADGDGVRTGREGHAGQFVDGQARHGHRHDAEGRRDPGRRHISEQGADERGREDAAVEK